MELKTATDELSLLAERAVNLAGDRGVKMVPVAPITRQGAYVCLDPEDIDLEDFLDLVVAAQQKLAYIEPAPFDVDDLVELAEDDVLGEELDPVPRAQRAKLRQSAPGSTAGRPAWRWRSCTRASCTAGSPTPPGTSNCASRWTPSCPLRTKTGVR
ncbi:hypothetical protein AB0F88_43065 [Streptosporangium sp. NPDC023963]|uniref:hypothetical protein n=1 Tax=Streptosporangium sp. NPDC023963 TaxID=3155608 RepID=UPI00341937EC